MLAVEELVAAPLLLVDDALLFEPLAVLEDVVLLGAVLGDVVDEELLGVAVVVEELAGVLVLLLLLVLLDDVVELLPPIPRIDAIVVITDRRIFFKLYGMSLKKDNVI